MLLLLTYIPSILTLLCLLILWQCRWRDYSQPLCSAPAPADEDEGDAATTLPPVTIVLPAHNQAPQLRENLPRLLEQDYPRFDIVVADQSSTDDTLPLLTSLEARHPNLRHTIVPATSRHIHKTTLALTLGIRAARTPWVLLTRADCSPASPRWLATLAAHCRPGIDLVGGYANYTPDPRRSTRRARHERLLHQLRLLRAVRSHRPAGAEPCNLLLRRETFLHHSGYAAFLRHPVGQTLLLADQLATPENIVLHYTEEAALHQPAPSAANLRNQRAALAQARRQLSPRARRWQHRAAIATLGQTLLLVSLVAALIISAVLNGSTAGEPTSYSQFSVLDYQFSFPNLLPLLSTYLPALLPLLAALIALLLPALLLRRTARRLGEPSIGLLLPAWYALVQPLRTLRRHLSPQRRYERPPLPQLERD